MNTLYIGDDPNREDGMKHNYMRKLVDLRQQGKIVDGLHLTQIYHDDWCEIYKGGYCNCDPDIQITVNPFAGIK